MEPTKKPHWDNPKFDDLIEDAKKANDDAEYFQRLKKAYLHADAYAPPGTITVGKAHIRELLSPEMDALMKELSEETADKTPPPPNTIDAGSTARTESLTIILENMRRILDEEGLLKESANPRSPRTPPRIRWWGWWRRAKKEL